MSKKVNIELSEAEYKKLIDIAAIGEWIINSHTVDTDASYNKVLTKVLSYSKGTSSEAMVSKFNELNEEEILRLLNEYINPYENHSFLQKQIEMQSMVAVIEQHGEKKFLTMSEEEKMEAMYEKADKIMDEMEASGVEFPEDFMPF